MATTRTWTFRPHRGDISTPAWCWEATAANAGSRRSQRAFASLEDCWFDAVSHGFEVPHPDKPWEGFSIRTLDDGSLVYVPI